MPLRYGSRVVGVIVISKLGLDQFDEDDVRLLEVLAGHARSRSRTQASTSRRDGRRRARRSCSSSAASSRRRRASTTSTSASSSSTATLIGSPRTSVWIADEEAGGSSRASCTARRATRSRRVVGTALPGQRRRGKLGAGPSRSCSPRTSTGVAIATRSTGRCRTRSRRSAVGLSGAAASSRHFPGGDFGERELRLLGGLAHQAKLAIANARNYEGLEKLSSRRSRRSRTRSKGERRVHLDARTVDHRSRASRRRRAPARRARMNGSLQAARARRAAARHRQDRHPERDPLEARPPHRRGARGDRDASGARRADHRADRPAPGGGHDRPALPRALGRQGYPDGISDDEVPLESRIIFVCDAYHAMTTDRPVPQAAEPSRGRAPAARGRGLAVRRHESSRSR